MKIVSTGNTISSPEFREKKLRARRKRQIIYFFSLVVFLIAFVFVSRLEQLRIKSVSVVGAQVVGGEAVEVGVREALRGYYFWIIPHDNIFLYPKQKIVRELNERFPRFDSITVSRQGLNTLLVSVSEREPFALYCTIDKESPCYFLDHDGFIFDFAPSFSEGVYFIYIDTEGGSDPLGTAFLPPIEFKALTTLIKNLERISIRSLSVEMSREEFQFVLPSAGRVRVSRAGDLTQTFSNLESFLLNPTISAQADFIKKLRELDLRTENKVFWKVK